MALLLIGMLPWLSGCAGSGTSFGAASSTVSDPSVLQRPADDLLRVGDGLIIRLSGVPPEDQGVYEVRIDESGMISMPYVGNIQAAGTTTVDLKQRIEGAYRSRGIYSTPNVTVFTREARFVNVTGEVRAPQRVPYTKDLTAVGAIAACGGFTDFANRRKVNLLRGGRRIEFNAAEILRDPSKDIPLMPDDNIQVDRSIF
ncbi:MAG: polysaccharide biosynthesis/export family protein [Verrucomicrobiia bacterium]